MSLLLLVELLLGILVNDPGIMESRGAEDLRQEDVTHFATMAGPPTNKHLVE